MNTNTFFLKYLGKFLDFDNGFGPQCVDVIKAYFKLVLGLEPVQGNAIDYWRDIPGFTRIVKTAFNQPNPGDVIIWNTNYNSPNGHIAVCNWSRFFDFNVFGQNDPLGTPCQYKTYYNYKNVIGWLRPLQPVTGPIPFVMKYTVFNQSPSLMEEAKNLMLQYSGGKIDVQFNYVQIPPLSIPGLLNSEQQVSFIKSHYISGPFAFLGYISTNTPNYDYMSTNGVIGSNKILTIQEGKNPTPFLVCYEMTHAIQYYCQSKGFPQTVSDTFQPDEAFLLQKLSQVIPLIGRLQ